MHSNVITHLEAPLHTQALPGIPVRTPLAHGPQMSRLQRSARRGTQDKGCAARAHCSCAPPESVYSEQVVHKAERRLMLLCLYAGTLEASILAKTTRERATSSPSHLATPLTAPCYAALRHADLFAPCARTSSRRARRKRPTAGQTPCPVGWKLSALRVLRGSIKCKLTNNYRTCTADGTRVLNAFRTIVAQPRRRYRDPRERPKARDPREDDEDSSGEARDLRKRRRVSAAQAEG